MMTEEQKKKVELAMSKLTDEEKELLGLVKIPKVKKNYTFKIYYMIGDANGETTYKEKISLDNPFVDIVNIALGKLDDIPGYWGVCLNDTFYDGNFNLGKITKLECDLLKLVTYFDEYREDEESEDDVINFCKEHGFEYSEKIEDYILEFQGLLTDSAEYSYLVYQGHSLK